MNGDPELAAWQRQWQARTSEEDANDWNGLKERVNRQSRRMRIGLIAPILVTIGIGGYLLMRALSSTQLADVLLLVEGWIFIAVTWTGCLWIARSTWRPFGETTAAFVDLAIRRCRSNLTGSRLGLWLYCAQLVCVYLLALAIGGERAQPAALLTSWPMILLGWIGLPAYILWRIWFDRRQRTELTRLFDLQRQLTGREPSQFTGDSEISRS